MIIFGLSDNKLVSRARRLGRVHRIRPTTQKHPVRALETSACRRPPWRLRPRSLADATGGRGDIDDARIEPVAEPGIMASRALAVTIL